MAAVRWCVLMTVTLSWLTIAPLDAGPVSINPAISPFGRNIRPIACKSKSGQIGTCMFAMDCTRMHGEHLGTCIDRFYFGSCCAASIGSFTTGSDPGNHIDSSSVTPIEPMTSHHPVSSEHPNALNDLKTTTSPSPISTVPALSTGGPTLIQLLSSSPTSTLLTDPSVTTEGALTTLLANLPAVGTDSPVSQPNITNNNTSTTTTTTTTSTTSTTSTLAPLSTTINQTTSDEPVTTPKSTEAPTTTPVATTTSTHSPSTTTRSPSVESTTSAVTKPAELTVNSSASSVLPDETLMVKPELIDFEDYTTNEPVTELPSVSLEPAISTEVVSSTQELAELTTISNIDDTTDAQSTDSTKEEVSSTISPVILPGILPGAQPIGEPDSQSSPVSSPQPSVETSTNVAPDSPAVSSEAPITGPAVSSEAPITGPAVTSEIPVSGPAVTSGAIPATGPVVTSEASPVTSPAGSSEAPITTPTVTSETIPVTNSAVTSEASPVTSPAVTSEASPVTSPAASTDAPITSPAITTEASPATGPAITSEASSVTGQEVTGPAVTGPAVTGPALTGPALTGPAVTSPAVTGPAVTSEASPVPDPVVTSEASPVTGPAFTSEASPVSGPAVVVTSEASPATSPASSSEEIPVTSPASNQETSPSVTTSASSSNSSVPETTTASFPTETETSPAPILVSSSLAPEAPAAVTDMPVVDSTTQSVLNESSTISIPSSPVAGSNETIDGATVQFQNYREVCGRPKYQYPSARIVGGTTTQYGQWPWQVSLRQWRTATFLHKCGAALLNENWAITAAHCVDNVQPDDLLLRMGEYDLATDEEEYPYVERKVQIVASHPQFDSRTFEYDLALLRFYDPVRFQPNIVPICLPPPGEVDFVGRTAYVTGWGRLYEDGPLPSKMQQVSVPVINNTDCENMYRRAGYVEHIPNIFICAGYADGKRDSCEGDSGGPMVIQQEDSWVLAGVISWGIGCAEANQPGVYTRISEFREWIDKIIVF